LVEGVGDGQTALGFGQVDLEDVAEVLAASEAGLDVVLDPGAAAPLFSSLEGFA
jgi:hypothetical protein